MANARHKTKDSDFFACYHNLCARIPSSWQSDFLFDHSTSNTTQNARDRQAVSVLRAISLSVVCGQHFLLNIETNEMNKERVSELLVSKSVDNDSVSKYISLLESCEMSRYTPMTLQNLEEYFEKASQVIGQIDKQL